MPHTFTDLDVMVRHVLPHPKVWNANINGASDLFFREVADWRPLSLNTSLDSPGVFTMIIRCCHISASEHETLTQ
jgi:hypothetical protein